MFKKNKNNKTTTCITKNHLDIGNSFSIEPSTNMMDVLGHSGYTFDAAIADIIDNSISAGAKNIDIYFDIDRSYLYILDDGSGMNEEEIHNSMIPAYRSMDDDRKSADLGRYSLGLKSASKSFCQRLYVCSKNLNQKTNAVLLDFEYIKEKEKWVAFNIDKIEYTNLIKDSGTIVIWEDLKLDDSSLVYNIFEELESSLSHIFGKYIIEDNLNIYIQSSKSKLKSKIKPWNPFQLPSNKSTILIYDEKIKYNNYEIFVKSYILPTYSNLSIEDQKYLTGNGLIEQEGFYIYRNNRLIQEGGWLDLPNIKNDQKCVYARISVNIGTYLDDEFNVNYSKNKIILPQDLINKFLDIAKLARQKSKENFNYMKDASSKKSRIRKESEIKVWNTSRTNQGIKLSLNINHPIIKEIFNKLDKSDSNKLSHLISSTLPIKAIQTQGSFLSSYDKDDIKQLMKETYEQQIKTKTVKEIQKQFYHTEPFLYYPEEIIDFFISLESEKNDK